LIEMTGFMHVCYLIRDMSYWVAGKPIQSNEPPRDAVQNLFHWGRVLFSLVVLAFSLAVTIEALFDGKTTIWDGVPEWLALVLFFVLMSAVGLLEAMQIAFFAVSKIPEEERGDAPWARRTCEVLFRNGGRNLPGFMVGRQMTVTLCFFVIARVTTLNVETGQSPTQNIFGVSDPVQEFFNLGFLGAIITTILGSISWQLVASAFPIAFLSNPIVYIFLRLALLLEATGLIAGAWFLAAIHKRVAGFQYDEVYVGTPEERAAGMKPDHSVHPGREFSMGQPVLHPVGASGDAPAHVDDILDKLGPRPETYSQRRERILKNIKDMKEFVKDASTDDERNAYEAGLKMELKALEKLNEDEQGTDNQMKDVEDVEAPAGQDA
jgi:silicon transporter